jgi:DhnA family fructose-bisphosphate aldolase class Ia
MNVKSRFNRLMGRDGKCFDVAIDHGFFNERSFLVGIENMPMSVRTIAEAAPDAIQLSPGQAMLLQNIPGSKPALVLRTDVANVYGSHLPRTLFSQLIENPIEQALRLDAACVVVNLLELSGQPELYRQCITNICRLKPGCDRYGVPLMVEPLVMRADRQSSGYMIDGDIEKILPLVRQAVELGADLIKADPCEDLSRYGEVIEVASGKPVLVRGGGKVTEEEIFKRTQTLMSQGAAGIVYGRNIIQHERPTQVVRALMAMVHKGATVRQALTILDEVPLAKREQKLSDTLA